jgi:hypothetical protein
MMKVMAGNDHQQDLHFLFYGSCNLAETVESGIIRLPDRCHKNHFLKGLILMFNAEV